MAQQDMLNCGIVHRSAENGDGIDEIVKEVINRYLTLVSSKSRTTTNKIYQNWHTGTILQKIISSEKEIYSIVSNETGGSSRCELM